MCVVIRIILVVLLIVAFNPFSAIAQSEEKDKAAAIKAAHQVSRYLQQTQDIRPMLRKYAVKNFLDGTSDDHLFNVFAFLDKDVLPKLDKKTKEEYYIEASNWLFLHIMFNCLNKPKKNAFGGPDFVHPREAETFMRGKPHLSNLINATGDKIKTVEAVQKVVPDLKKVNSIYRRHVNVLRRMPYKQYLLIAKKSLGGGEDFFTTEVSKCDDDRECAGLPRGSRLILISMPGFLAVDFGRVNRQMKVIHIFHSPGD